jgi:hypothetical protein
MASSANWRVRQQGPTVAISNNWRQRQQGPTMAISDNWRVRPEQPVVKPEAAPLQPVNFSVGQVFYLPPRANVDERSMIHIQIAEEAFGHPVVLTSVDKAKNITNFCIVSSIVLGNRALINALLK